MEINDLPIIRIEYLVHIVSNKAIHVEFSDVLEVEFFCQYHDAPTSTNLFIHY